MRVIDNISYSLTTHCNMSCPDCCAAITAMPKKDRVFYDYDYILNSAKYFKGIGRITLTGGEPSIHPKFEGWIPQFKEIFECKELAVWTNGTMFKKKPDVWKYFDIIHITNYTEKTFEGSPNNTKLIAWIKEYLKDTNVQIYSCEIEHIPLTKRGNKMCFRGFSDTVEFVNGVIYPCCVGSGLPIKKGLELCEDWRNKILEVHPPCEVCNFAEE